MSKQKNQTIKIKAWDQVFDAIDDLIFIQDVDFTIVKANKAFYETMGLIPQDVIGKKCYNILHNTDHPWHRCPFERTGADHKVHTEKVDDPAIGIPLLITTSPIFDDKGIFLGSVHTAKNITEQHAVEKALKESEQKYRSVVENIGIGVAVISPQMELLSINKKMREWFPDVDLNNNLLCYEAFSNPSRRARCLQCPTGKTLQDGCIHEAVIDTPTPDGLMQYRIISSPITNNDGTVIAAIEMVEDITEQKKYEQKIIKSEQKYKTLFSSSQDAIMTLAAPLWQFTSCNPACIKLFGARNEAEFIAKAPWELSPDYQPDGCLSLKKARRMIEKAMQQGSACFEWIHKRFNGQTFTAQVTLTKVMIEEAHPFLQATVRDITERVRFEKELTEREERFKTLVSNIPGISYRCAYDEDRTMSFISDEVETLTGYPATDFIENARRSFAGIIHLDDVTTVDEKVREGVEHKRPYIIEYRLIDKTGALHWVYEKGRGIFDDQGDLLWLDGVIIDITDRKEVEALVYKVQQDLEIRIEERTKELQTKLHELERFRKATVDREFRIEELHKRIKELEEK